MTTTRYIGLISGTSMDGIDAALIEIDAGRTRLVQALSHALPGPVSSALLDCLDRPDAHGVAAIGALDAALGDCFADAALALLAAAGVHPAAVDAIGSHGQTLFHAPDHDPPFTWQAGDPARIAHRTGIPTVADFRRADIAAGGQGAPLAPLFHAEHFASGDETRVVLNLGGIANVTLLEPGSAVRGFDTGPANTLLDLWAREAFGTAFDRGGEFGAQGNIDRELLSALLDEPYFGQPAPKSTGRERFNRAWLRERANLDVAAARSLPEQRRLDVMATLCELSATSIADALRAHGAGAARVIACGGGVHNPLLMGRIRSSLPDAPLVDSGAFGLDPDWIEAVTFGWLAHRRVTARPVNTPPITGASMPVAAGAVYLPPQPATMPTEDRR
jgi:anhydro-N-acetylmuramic acid kinase